MHIQHHNQYPMEKPFDLFLIALCTVMGSVVSKLSFGLILGLTSLQIDSAELWLQIVRNSIGMVFGIVTFIIIFFLRRKLNKIFGKDE